MVEIRSLVLMVVLEEGVEEKVVLVVQLELVTLQAHLQVKEIVVVLVEQVVLLMVLVEEEVVVHLVKMVQPQKVVTVVLVELLQ